MSWCRWSSMEYACDLYVYESDAGVEVHIARLRSNIDRDALPPGGEFGSLPWSVRRQALSRALDIAVHYPIGLPHDGETRVFDTLWEAADWIDELGSLGYIVPQGMTQRMRETTDL